MARYAALAALELWQTTGERKYSDKALEFLAAGAKMVWVLDPEPERVMSVFANALSR